MVKPVICITLNPAIDRAGEVDELNFGRVNIVKKSFDRFGGKGINMADVLVQFGIETIASGLMGSKSVADFKANLQSRGIQYAFSTVPGETRQNLKLITPKGETTDINFPAFECSPADVDLVLAMVMAYDFDYISLGGSLPASLPDDTYAYMISELKKNGKKILLDTSKDALKKAVKEKPWFIKPNNFELEDLTQQKLGSIKEIIQAAKEIQQQYVENVAVSLGEDGGIFCSAEGCYHVIPPKMNIVSTVGAGDSLVGAWLAAKISECSDLEAAKTAIAASAISVTHLGVGTTDMAAFNELKDKLTVIKL
ncbi:MAG: 1-phosphofructokinase family hexose kinase [Alphaproteobacteria bacterium]